VSLRRAAWHPSSEAHLCCLLSDGTLRLYAVPAGGAGGAAASDAPRLAREQELALCPEGPPPAGAMRPGAPPAAPAVDFAFWPAEGGARAGWSSLAAVLLMRDGSLRLLCPAPVPFGAHLPRPQVAAMAAALEPAPGDASARAWLEAALPLSRADAAPQPAPGAGGETPAAAAGRAARAAAEASMVRCAPHCLHGAAAALQGPLAAAQGGGGAPACALALASVPGAPDAALLCCAGADGELRVSLLLGAPRPAFAAAPAAADRGLDGAPRRVRAAACPASPGAPLPAVVAMDLVTPLPGAAGGAGLPAALAWEPGPARRLFCAQRGCAQAVTLTWLPAVQRLLAGGAASAGGDVPLPRVEPLREGGCALAGCALLRDALRDEARLLLLATDGEARLAEATPQPPPAPATPPPAASPPLPPAAAAALAAEEARADAALEALAAGPPGGGAPPLPSSVQLRRAPADSVEAQACLAAAAAALRERHVAWAHRAHDELGRRGVRLGREGARQADALAQAQARADAARQRGAQLAARADRAAALADNVRRRAALLAELGRAAPALRDASGGAAAQLEAELRAWLEALPAVEGRLAELKARALAAAQAEAQAGDDGPTQPAELPPLPPRAAMMQLQQALARTGALLAASVDKVRTAEECVAEAEA
jgi:hypothetical protein